MAEQISGDTWGERLTLRIAERVRAVRMAVGMSTQELSDRTDALGHRVSRQSIVNLESGRKSQVAVDDLFILAHALTVNPMFLVHDPILQGSPVEVLPGLTIPQWWAIKWVTSRPDVVSGFLYEGDFDDGRAAISFRSQLDTTRQEIAEFETRIRMMEENGYDLRDADHGRLDKDEVETRVFYLRRQIEEKRSNERLLESILDSFAVQTNERWYTDRILTTYRADVWAPEVPWREIDAKARAARDFPLESFLRDVVKVKWSGRGSASGEAFGFDLLDSDKLDAETWRVNHDVPQDLVDRVFETITNG